MGYQEKRRFGERHVVRLLAKVQNMICPECHLPLDLSIRGGPLAPSTDHTIPISRGGQDAIENISVMHLVCNQRKGTRI